MSQGSTPVRSSVGMTDTAETGTQATVADIEIDEVQELIHTGDLDPGAVLFGNSFAQRGSGRLGANLPF